MSMKRRTRTYFKGFHDFLGPFGAQRLSLPAQSLLLAVLCQYDGSNNGALKITASVLPARWGSSDLRQKARKELLENYFIFEVAKGRRPNVASLYAVACYPLDANHQHDPELRDAFDPDAWRQPTSKPSGGTGADANGMVPYAATRHNAAFAMPPHGIVEPSIVPPHGIAARFSLCRHTATSYKSTRLCSGIEPAPAHGRLH